MPKVHQATFPKASVHSVPYNQTRKSVSERKRRDEINELLENLKTIVQNPSDSNEKISHETILFRVFERVSGVDLETKFNSTVDIPKAEGNTKEEKQKVKTKREQIRRSKQDICYTELGNFVHKNRLGNTEQRNKLERVTVLQIILEYICQMPEQSEAIEKENSPMYQVYLEPTKCISPEQSVASPSPFLLSNTLAFFNQVAQLHFIAKLQAMLPPTPVQTPEAHMKEQTNEEEDIDIIG
ncbi:BHLH domain-containing protein [Caenorhabditis elegans]|uniref:BHLH domain-containing protein n=1 Tax=Caenorhabditis elegans TaxID=6239 RepID=Q19917_CAEEL|nr:BHLH domain-containing protein [Caenorhabditis elegans]CCD70292.1 BHLH domain-containing protein [Caenorhabditis elegans]|eukprot:NP_510837.1 Helix Loop Helix [Caenorhabditis elegans]